MTFRPAMALLHASAAGIMAYGYEGLESLPINKWIRSQKGGHFQFLTVQGLAIAWLTMVFGLAADLFPSVSLFRTTKRALFMVSMPVAVVVSSFYWSLLLFSPELILIPEPGDFSSASPVLSRLPLSLDLALHITPLFSLIADFTLLDHKYTKWEASYGAPMIISLSTIWYSLWVEYCARYNGVFPYPFLTNNTFDIRLVIYALAAGLALVSFWSVNACHPESVYATGSTLGRVKEDH